MKFDPMPFCCFVNERKVVRIDMSSLQLAALSSRIMWAIGSGGGDVRGQDTARNGMVCCKNRPCRKAYKRCE